MLIWYANCPRANLLMWAIFWCPLQMLQMCGAMTRSDRRLMSHLIISFDFIVLAMFIVLALTAGGIGLWPIASLGYFLSFGTGAAQAFALIIIHDAVVLSKTTIRTMVAHITHAHTFHFSRSMFAAWRSRLMMSEWISM